MSGDGPYCYYKGELLSDVLKKQRITIEEVYMAGRSHGVACLDDIEVVVLETTGDLTVISKLSPGYARPETLENVSGYPGAV